MMHVAPLSRAGRPSPTNFSLGATTVARRVLVLATCALFGALVACGGDSDSDAPLIDTAAPAGGTSPTPAPAATETAIQEGDACDTEGAETSCFYKVRTGTYDSCWASTRVCSHGVWGPCQGGRVWTADAGGAEAAAAD